MDNEQMQEMLQMVLKNQEEIMETQKETIGRLKILEENILRLGSYTNSNIEELEELKSMVSALLYR